MTTLETDEGLRALRFPECQDSRMSLDRPSQTASFAILSSLLECIDRVPSEAFQPPDFRLSLGDSGVVTSPLPD